MKESKSRPDLYVIYRILKTLIHGPTTKSGLALHARLNYQRALRYLEYLEAAGLVEVGKEVKITKKGLEMLEKMEEVIRELEKGDF